MQIGRLGTLIGFAIGAAGAGVQIVAPEYKVFGWLLLIIALGTILVGGYYWLWERYEFRAPWRLRVLGPEPSPARRPGLPAPASATKVPLSQSLYVGEVRFGLGGLPEHHLEITVKVFNGSGRNVHLVGISGRINWAVPNTSDTAKSGSLPVPSLRTDTQTKVSPFQEWFLIFNQHVPSKDADNIRLLLDRGERIHFDLSVLTVTVADNDGTQDRLPMWSGVSAVRGIESGRIINATVHIGLGVSATGAAS